MFVAEVFRRTNAVRSLEGRLKTLRDEGRVSGRQPLIGNAELRVERRWITSSLKRGEPVGERSVGLRTHLLPAVERHAEQMKE